MLSCRPDDVLRRVIKRAAALKIRNVTDPVMRQIEQRNDEDDNGIDRCGKRSLRNGFFLGL